MSRSKNRAATAFAVIAFLLTLAGCSAAREGGRQAAAGAFEEAEAWWATKKPELIAVARTEGAEVAERVVARAEASLEARAEASREKQRRGEPLSDEDRLYLYLAVGAPFLAALLKSGLRYVRGDSATPPATPPTT